MKRVKLLPFIFEFTWLQKKFTIEWLNKQTWKYEIFSLYFITFSYLIIHIYAHAHLHSYIFSIVANRKIKHSNILNWIEWEPYVVGVRISRAIKYKRIPYKWMVLIVRKGIAATAKEMYAIEVTLCKYHITMKYTYIELNCIAECRYSSTYQKNVNLKLSQFFVLLFAYSPNFHILWFRHLSRIFDTPAVGY